MRRNLASCLSIHQLNRSVENRSDKRRLLADLRGSGQLEEHADVALMLYRDGYYYPGSERANIMEIWVRKNRLGGPSGTVCEQCPEPVEGLFWQGEYSGVVSWRLDEKPRIMKAHLCQIERKLPIT